MFVLGYLGPFPSLQYLFKSLYVPLDIDQSTLLVFETYDLP